MMEDSRASYLAKKYTTKWMDKVNHSLSERYREANPDHKNILIILDPTRKVGQKTADAAIFQSVDKNLSIIDLHLEYLRLEDIQDKNAVKSELSKRINGCEKEMQ